MEATVRECTVQLATLYSALEGILTGPLHHHVVLLQTMTPAVYKSSVTTMMAHLLGDNTFGGTSRHSLTYHQRKACATFYNCLGISWPQWSYLLDNKALVITRYDLFIQKALNQSTINPDVHYHHHLHKR